jgi:hypothetical protein
MLFDESHHCFGVNYHVKLCVSCHSSFSGYHCLHTGGSRLAVVTSLQLQLLGTWYLHLRYCDEDSAILPVNLHVDGEDKSNDATHHGNSHSGVGIDLSLKKNIEVSSGPWARALLDVFTRGRNKFSLKDIAACTDASTLEEMVLT